MRDPLLPYLAMFARPARARRLVTGLLEQEGVSREVADDPHFVSPGRLAIRASAVVAVIAALVLSITTTAGSGFPAQINGWVFEDSGAAITIPVPEPGTVASLFALVGGAAAMRQWRRRKAA